ncbi:hypothetical protein ONZ45_g2582 [Pleurotus djamor]|nr:hypothetical protein ONZ45_g2582 [Pleurotus djamor]
MRNSMSTLSARAGPSTGVTATPPASSTSQPVPTIRLISATPSATGLSSTEGSTSFTEVNSSGYSWASPQPPAPTSILPTASFASLKPKASTSSLNPTSKRRLVPKKSKLSILGIGSNNNSAQSGSTATVIPGQPSDRDKDLSDVLRRVGANGGSTKGKSGIEIYVDPTEDPEFGELVVVRKKKSRVGLDDVSWGGESNGGMPLREKSNTIQTTTIGKAQEGGKDKWWSIGRGRKESKEGKVQTKPKVKSPLSQVHDENVPTSLTTRFNSVSNVMPRSTYSTTLLTSSKLHPITNPIHRGSLRATSSPSPVPPSISLSTTPEPIQEQTYSRCGTPTAGGLLAPPSLHGQPTQSAAGNGNQGSIALRAIRSVRSLARIGSWAQLKNGDDEVPVTEPKKVEVKKEKKEREKKEKKGTVKKSKSEKESKEKKKSETLRVSTSSFEVGALSPAKSVRPPTFDDGSLKAPQTLGKKRSTLLGIGLPSTMTMRLPSVRSGSNASSILVTGANNANGPASVGRVFLVGRDRSESGASSLRPMSTSSGISSSSSGYSGRTSVASERTGTTRISNGSCASVRWDEDALKKRREERDREREAVRSLAKSSQEHEEEGGEKKKKKDKKDKDKSKRKEGKESRRSSEGRKRTPLNEIFPDAISLTPPKEHPLEDQDPVLREPAPVWNMKVETATNDGHGVMDTDEEAIATDSVTETPVKKPRRRPMSEQLLGTMQAGRPRGMYVGSEDGTDGMFSIWLLRYPRANHSLSGTMSILSAATNDLAQLINHLDLEATPNTPDLTPLRPSPSLSLTNTPSQSANSSPSRSAKARALLPESPLKGLRASMASISSLRPYAQSRDPSKRPSEHSLANQFKIGQEITHWPTLRSIAQAEPPAPLAAAATITPSRLKHKRATLPSPGPPPAEPSPVFQPLRPAKARARMSDAFLDSPSKPAVEFGASRAPSCLTFGSHSRSSSAKSGSVCEEAALPSPLGSIFKKTHTRKKSSLIHYANSDAEDGGNQSDSIPILPETKRVLGMTGTMGASVAEGYAVELDASDPDSDIPDELQILLAGQSDAEDTLDFPRSAVTTASPPVDAPLNVSASSDYPYPQFHAALIDENDHHIDLDTCQSSSDDDDTKRSFDFTGELQLLNESGASDRRSFVEQLENAFRTPAKLDLKTLGNGLLQVNIPPVPALPVNLEGSSQSSSDMFSFDSYSSDQILDVKELTMLKNQSQTNSGSIDLVKNTVDLLLDTKEPTLLPGSDSLATTDSLISMSETTDESKLDALPSQSLPRKASKMGSKGQLNVDFKFGGLPRDSPQMLDVPKPVTLSDIIPPVSHQRSLSDSSQVMEDDSVLNSIFARASELPVAFERKRLDSDSSSKRRARSLNRASVISHSRAHSADSARLSFVGFESFDEVRRGFEFSGPRPAFYPPPVSTNRRNHLRQESGMSFASISSYGHVINNGVPDPFDYALPSLQERPSSEDMSSISMSMTVDDTFSFIHRQPRRRRVDSDSSSFYFRSSVISSIQPYQARGHARQESNFSVASFAPPVSLYNRSFAARHHRRNSSNTSASSVAQSYAMYGVGGGRASWARHQRQEASFDSVMSDFSAMRLGRPGIGDKMFETSGDQGMPLTSITASPPGSASYDRTSGSMNPASYDSIFDNDRLSTVDDSIFDKTGHRSSVSSEFVFGNDDSHAIPGRLLPPHQFRPLSMFSVNSVHSPPREDETMISMIGGGHVRRGSVGSMIQASPCVRIGRKKKQNLEYDGDAVQQPRIMEKPSIASTSSYQFGGERMIKAQHGLLARQSLEESCLIAEGEDTSSSFILPVFSRPGPASRSRSSTCTSSSGGDTPPLSASDGSSISGGSQSSIDMSQLNIMLSNATHPVSSLSYARARARVRGHGHRRRISEARASRSSVYETIEEEMSVTSSPARPGKGDSTEDKETPLASQRSIYIVDPEVSFEGSPRDSMWDDEQGLLALRQYYALRDEAHVTVSESQRVWLDTPFSLFALQSFHPPHHPAGMQALLEHSVQNYGPLPSELRVQRVRSRTQSRASPYPQARTFKVSVSPEQDLTEMQRPFSKDSQPFNVLQPLAVNSNVELQAAIAVADKKDKKILSPKKASAVDAKRENAWGLAPNARPRVGSAARRSALGWSKRSAGAKSSTDQKENVGQGSMIMTPGETLRISRPRPRGRPTPSTRPKPIRV